MEEQSQDPTCQGQAWAELNTVCPPEPGSSARHPAEVREGWEAEQLPDHSEGVGAPGFCDLIRAQSG